MKKLNCSILVVPLHLSLTIRCITSFRKYQRQHKMCNKTQATTYLCFSGPPQPRVLKILEARLRVWNLYTIWGDFKPYHLWIMASGMGSHILSFIRLHLILHLFIFLCYEVWAKRQLRPPSCYRRRFWKSHTKRGVSLWHKMNRWDDIDVESQVYKWKSHEKNPLNKTCPSFLKTTYS